MTENTNNPWLTGGNKYALNAQKIAKAKKDGTYVNDTTKGVDPKHTNNDAPKAATLLQDTGTQLLHGVQTLGGSVIGDAVNAVSPSAAKWLDKNTWGMVPHTTQEQFEANRPSTQRDRWNNSVANEKPSSSTWENRTTDSANAVTSAVAGEVIGGAMGWLGKKIKPKDTRFLINQLGFNAPAAKSATVSMPFKDKLAMAELDAKRKLSRGWRDVKKVANKATLPIRDYKDYKTARKLQRDLRYDAWNFTSDGSPKYNLEQLRNHVFEKVKLKYSDKASNFDAALSSLELKGLWAGKNSNAAKRANFWKSKVTPKEVPRNTDWLNMPITEGNFKKFSKTREFRNMEPYMYFTEFTDSPNNKFVGDKWGLKTFREFDYLLNKNRVKPPQSLRTEYGAWADNLNTALAEKSKRDIKVGGSSLSFIKGHTNKLPGDIDRYVWDKNAGQKFVEWKSGDGPLYKFGNINFSGTQGQPGIAQVHKAYQNPVELHSINMSNVNKALRGAKPSTDFKVDPTNLDMSNATLTDLFLSSKPKHVDRFYQVASNSSYDELSKAFNTKLSGMSSKKVDFPEFVTSNVKDNLEFLRRAAPELGGKELSNLAADQNKMKIILNNFYLDTSTGTRYTRNYKHGVSKNITDPTNLKKILHSSDGSGGQAYTTPGLLDVYYGKGNTNAGYGDISMTTKASLNLPNKPTPKDLLDNMTNYKDGVRLVSQDIMTFPHSTSVGYGVGEPLSVSAGSTNSFAPRIINPENSIRLRELDNAIRGQLSVKKADLSPKHAKKLKSSLNTKYPYGIPEDKQHLYNLLESYSDKVKYDKLNYSWFSSMGEKYPRWRHKIQNVDIGDVSIPQLNERAWRKNLNKAGTAYSNAKAVVGGSSLVGGVYAGGKALTDHTERKFQKEYAKMRQDKEASDKKWLDLRLDAGISEEDARIERRGEFNRNDSLRSDSRRQWDNWENEGLSKSKIRAKYKELEGKNREESIKRRTARDNELKAMIQERARKLREISSKKSGGVLKAQKGTNSRFFGPVDPKVHEDTRNYIAENVSDSTQQQRWQDLNRMSGYPRFTKTDSTFTGTPHYNPITNATVGLPLQEQAHAYQHNAEGSLVKGTVTDWLKFPYFTKAGQSKLYGKKGTQEYDAHTVIPQVFNRFINGGIKESQVKPYIEMRRNAKQGEEDFSTPYTKKDDYKTVYRLQEGLGKRHLLHDSVKVAPGVFDGVLNKETIQALKNFNTKK